MDSPILQLFIYRTIDDISGDSYTKLIENHPEKSIIKSLIVNFPFHQKKKNLFYRAATFRMKIRNWFNYGIGDSVIGAIAFFVGIYTIAIYLTSSTNLHNIGQEPTEIIVYIFALIMSFLIFMMSIFIAFRIIILIFLRAYKYTLYIVARPTL